MLGKMLTTFYTMYTCSEVDSVLLIPDTCGSRQIREDLCPLIVPPKAYLMGILGKTRSIPLSNYTAASNTCLSLAILL